MTRLLDKLREHDIATVDINGGDRLLVHARVLERKRLLKSVFHQFHRMFDHLDRKHLGGTGIRIELGAGVAPIRDTYPDVLASDVVVARGLDFAIDAGRMALANGSVRVLFGQNCFHHFPDPIAFFNEMDRVVAPGGGAILLEPYHGPLATLLYPRLFHTEGFDKTYPSWQAPTVGPMNGANQALSYIVFVRDRALFEKQFPHLQIVADIACGNYVRYLASGGLNFRQLCPGWVEPILTSIEWALSPFRHQFALHHVIVIKKTT